MNGELASPAFRFLRRKSELHSDRKMMTKQVPWNFTKFLVNRNADKVVFLHPRTSQKDIVSAIKKMIYEEGEKPF